MHKLDGIPRAELPPAEQVNYDIYVSAPRSLYSDATSSTSIA
jgi:hypothetical protein